ncbi:MAG: N-6 DNA methylase [Cyanobacteria bacterium TGS_CYA1]|nr:N-6 DNA methylase [Cyanobacteria bacterium TGS_CYA1]
MAKPAKGISNSSKITELKDLDSAIVFVDILKRQGYLTSFPASRGIWLGACYCLAARCVLPANLSNAGVRLIEALSPDCLLDESPLAARVANYLNELESRCGPLAEPEIDLPLNIEFFHSLLPAWIFQILAQDESASTYTQARQSRSIDELPRLTQWFTPRWISTYLAKQSINENTNTFLDPACGGGHLLAEALKNLCKERGLSPNQALKLIWGFDVDMNLLKLSSLSLYLCALDLNKNSPDPKLSVPNLYCIEAPDAEFGSLLLGIESENFKLVRFDGAKKESHDCPVKFDAIAANPPYLGYRLMPKKMVAFLRSQYKNAHFDLYSAFLELATRLVSKHGTISFICQQSFLNIARYQILRQRLLAEFKFKSIVTLGPGAFETRSGEKVSSVIVTLEQKEGREIDSELRHTDLREASYKRKAKLSGIEAMPASTISHAEMTSTSSLVTGNPILPDCPKEIALLFSRFPQLDSDESGITVTNGLFTCDNKRFVKHFSQIEESQKDSYVPYDKGGGHKWFATTPYRIWWKDQGDSIRKLRVERGQSKSLPGEDFYFKSGITYSYIGTRGFKARLLSPQSVFDIASSSLFCDEENLHYLLGFLNSSLAIFILGQLNPTVNFQIGDIRRIPYCKPTPKLRQEMESLVTQSIALAKCFDLINPESPSFNLALSEIGEDSTKERTKAYVDELNKKEKSLQAQIDQNIFTLYSVSDKIQQRIKENFWVKNSRVFLV